MNYYTELFTSGWKLISYKSFLRFIWGEKWYWSKVSPHIGPFTTKEALAIHRFLVETKSNEVV